MPSHRLRYQKARGKAWPFDRNRASTYHPGMRRKRTPEDLAPTPVSVKVPMHIARDLETMVRNTGRTMDDLVTTALKMFVSTHNDFLGLRREGP